MYADRASKDLGIDLDLRKCRRTYGQRLVDAGVAISVVSVVMGHLSTRTTEQHYARVKHAVALKEVAKTFEHMEEAPPEYNGSQMARGFDSRRSAPREDQ